MNKLKRLAVSTVLMGMNFMMANAQDASKIKKGLEQATTEVSNLFDTVVKLLYAVCAILAVMGAFNVYSKWSNGDPDVTKSAAGWIGGLIFVVIAIIIIKGVFI